VDAFPTGLEEVVKPICAFGPQINPGVIMALGQLAGLLSEHAWTSIYRINRNGQEPIVDVDHAEEIEPAIRSNKPGRHLVDEISADGLPGGHTSRRWGVGIKRRDGAVVIEPDPWPES
jgi:hypothetical protein